MKYSVLTKLLSCTAMLLVMTGCDRQTDVPTKDQAGDGPLILETYIHHLQLEDDSVQTRFGELTLTRAEPDMPPDTLRLDREQVFREEAFYLSLHYYIKQNNRDLVLFGSNCGGTGCPRNQFYFLVLQADTQPLVLTQTDFTAYPDGLEIEVDGKRLSLDLGFQNGRHKVALLEDNQLTVALQTVPSSFVGKTNCRWVYDEALTSCMEYQDTDPNCTEPQNGFAGYLTRGLAAVAEHPGFLMDAFVRRCDIACRSGKLVDYPTFAKEVCSK